ncbi:Malto-oligosyltrehalose trehalohydrolase [Nitrospira sp. KM1]|uniref:malto-oligosyltrehalose trehalohydrolase n=1 Tax=Nitrospira sp. KM1 TaxID=1936990 RepID=UPI0013A775DC|nr:malto-oligosyltrehalose trehalohydrolase [Nitrospira sp. KM1]BCA56362.1 Malto-oligosyltrehalose trehalohydrolase [Nitrospira sp. KM1]
MSQRWALDIGANQVGDNATRFRVWAPKANRVAVKIEADHRQVVPMTADGQGHHEALVQGVTTGSRYRYVLDGSLERPDPVSRFQPDGVHGTSMVVDPGEFPWTDREWRGLSLKELIMYELHVGTFTKEGTFDAVIPHLPYLKNTVGITAIELMPVAQFPGGRNWGYDGAFPFAPQSTYGGPEGLRRLVNACHAEGMAVILDVVYNHMGPEGNYLGDFGPYFTDRYRTPWGSAINYDGPDSDPVRHYVVSNAVYWVTEYRIDGLRLDAVHGIYDFSARHVLRDIASAVHVQAKALNRQIVVIAESDLNDTRVIDAPSAGGFGLDGQWNDDFHHSLRVVLTGEQKGYYSDFQGLHDLSTAVQNGYVYNGKYSPHRRRRHGNSSTHCRPAQFVVFAQNHDQIGNRAEGDRLSARIPSEALKVSLALTLLSPQIPMLFMGEEYGETAPFQYFIEHSDPELIEAVRRGRRREFALFGWDPDQIPDPQAPSTFERSRVNRSGLDAVKHGLLRWTHALIEARKAHPVLAAGESATPLHSVRAMEEERVLIVHRWAESERHAVLIFGFNAAPVAITIDKPEGPWHLLLDSNSREFGADEQGRPAPELSVTSGGTSLTLSPSTVLVYISPDPRM